MRLLALSLVLVAVSAVSLAEASQYRAPRTAFGTPDLQGDWSNNTLTPLQRPQEFGEKLTLSGREWQAVQRAEINRLSDWNNPANRSDPAIGLGGGIIDPERNRAGMMEVGGHWRTSLITFPANGQVPPSIRPPAAPSAAASSAAVQDADNPETWPLDVRCLGPGTAGRLSPVLLPGLRGNYYRITQGRNSVVIQSETEASGRIVRLNAVHRSDGVRPWHGDSIGRWEGDTLVIETTHFPPAQAYRGSWENLKVTERITRISNTRLLYQFRFEDPATWREAWGGEYELHPAMPIEEYACHEAADTH